MGKETVLVIGLGEVGGPLLELLRESGRFDVYGLDIDIGKMRKLGLPQPPSRVDVMHICIPCFNREEFIKTTAEYVKQFKPKLVIIDSTVPPGTTMDVYGRCGCLVAHSPVRGMHKSPEYMRWELKRWTRYVGGANEESAEAAKRHFESLNVKTRVLRGSLETELAKLFETTYRAWMIVCFQEMHRISRSLKADFDEIADFLEDTHRGRPDKPLMFPGVIGGHCLIPNVKLLLSAYDSELLHLILKSNERRVEEVKDKAVRDEVEKVKARVERLESELMGSLIRPSP